jgi:hypothetical protein
MQDHRPRSILPNSSSVSAHRRKRSPTFFSAMSRMCVTRRRSRRSECSLVPCPVLQVREFPRYISENFRAIFQNRQAREQVAKGVIRCGAERKASPSEFVRSNATWKHGAPSVTFRQPFDLISKIATFGPVGGSVGGGNPTACPAWWRTHSTATGLPNPIP